jgi:N6-adenosine-specific RNA methylase IME4
MLGERELAELAEDIKANGLKHPIITIDGGGEWLILDGRNRWEACKRVGVHPETKVWAGKDPVAYVLSTNLRRRHLNESQRGMVAVEVEKLYAAEAAKNTGGRTPKPRGGESQSRQPRANLPEVSEDDRRPRAKAAAALNVSARLVQDAKRVATSAAPEVVEAVRAGRVAVADAVRVVKEAPERQAALVAKVASGEAKTLKEAAQKATKAEVVARIQAEPQPMPRGPFRVIVCDPPWQYDKRADDGTHRAANPYPSMSTDEICALAEQVKAVAHEDCILWLWTTNAFMRDAFRVLDAWGFQEKTILTWGKNRMGTGDWLRGMTEHCIMAARGKPERTLSNQTTLLMGDMREHSRKPESFYQLVQSVCPGSRLEMFAREKRPTWSAWGAEENKFDRGAK